MKKITWGDIARGLLFLGSVAAYLPMWLDVGRIGWGSGDYSHVFVIPLIGVVVYFMSKPVPVQDADLRGWAVRLWILGLGCRAAGWALNAEMLSALGLPAVIIGSVATLFGWTEGRRIMFLAFFLLFSLAVETKIMLAAFSGGLRLLASGAAYDTVSTFMPHRGPYVVNGHMLLTPLGRFDVVDECSGVRGLAALFIIGAVVGWRARLSLWQAVRFVVMLILTGALGNIVRVAVTLATYIAIRGRMNFDHLHTLGNAVIFGGCILATPALAQRVKEPRMRWTLVRATAVALALVYAALLALRAAEGSHMYTVQQKPGVSPEKPQVTLVAQEKVPRLVLLLSSPGRGPSVRWWCVLTGGLIHWNLMHFLTNVGVMLLLGEALRGRLGAWRPGIPLLGGQIISSLVGWLIVAPLGDTKLLNFVGASGAVSALFGTYLVQLLQERQWKLTAMYSAAYALGMWLSKESMRPPLTFSPVPHIAALIFGMIVAAPLLAKENDGIRTAPSV